MTNFELAKSRSLVSGKPIMLSFSGSDWCSWCMKLEAELFSQKEFIDWADEHVIFLKVDFPRRHVLPPAEQEENDKLSAQYRIEGFPTVVLTDADGRELDRTGYHSGGVAAYLRDWNRMIKNPGSSPR